MLNTRGVARKQDLVLESTTSSPGRRRREGGREPEPDPVKFLSQPASKRLVAAGINPNRTSQACSAPRALPGHRLHLRWRCQLLQAAELLKSGFLLRSAGSRALVQSLPGPACTASSPCSAPERLPQNGYPAPAGPESCAGREDAGAPPAATGARAAQLVNAETAPERELALGIVTYFLIKARGAPTAAAPYVLRTVTKGPGSDSGAAHGDAAAPQAAAGSRLAAGAGDLGRSLPTQTLLRLYV